MLPSNVRVVQAEDPTSSYVFMDEARLGLVYTSTVGLELACTGAPVVVAADTHYRGRGFTIDPDSVDGYWLAADRVVSTPPDGDERARVREQARRYAALFFFRFHNVLREVTEDGRSRPVFASPTRRNSTQAAIPRWIGSSPVSSTERQSSRQRVLSRRRATRPMVLHGDQFGLP